MNGWIARVEYQHRLGFCRPAFALMKCVSRGFSFVLNRDGDTVSFSCWRAENFHRPALSLPDATIRRTRPPSRFNRGGSRSSHTTLGRHHNRVEEKHATGLDAALDFGKPATGTLFHLTTTVASYLSIHPSIHQAHREAIVCLFSPICLSV